MVRWAILTASAACAVSVRAAEPSDAELLVRAGIDLRRAGKDSEALQRFREAYALFPAQRTLAQIALAEQALERWRDAEVNLERALRAEDDPWIAARRPYLEEALAAVRERLGTIIVRSNVPGAAVIVNGETVGRAPATVRVEVGRATVEARGTGRPSRSAEVEVMRGRTVELQLDLPPVTAEATPVRNDESPPTQPTLPASEARAGDDGHAPWAAATLIAAGVGAATGTAALVTYEAFAADYNDPAQCGRRPSIECASTRNDANVARTIAIAGYSAAGALALTSVVLLVLPSFDKDRSQASWSIAAGPGQLWLRSTF